MKSFLYFLIQFVLFLLSLLVLVFGIRLASYEPVTGVLEDHASRDSTVTTSQKQVTSKTGDEITHEKTVVHSIPKQSSSGLSQKESYDLAYNYFILSAMIMIIAFLLPRLEKLTFPGGASLQLREEIKTLRQQVNLSQAASAKAGGKLREGGKAAKELKERFKYERISRAAMPVVNSDDPQKGRWGGFSESNGRELLAQVKARPQSPYYDVIIQVKSTSAGNPLDGIVKFHLHDSFSNPDPIITSDNGVAELRLVAWGAFTVGAELDNGATTLELDLAELRDAPEAFKKA